MEPVDLTCGNCGTVSRIHIQNPERLEVFLKGARYTAFDVSLFKPYCPVCGIRFPQGRAPGTFEVPGSGVNQEPGGE